MVVISRTCPLCGKSNSMEITEKEIDDWRKMLIQKAMPTRSIKEREFLISGMCSACQDMFFTEEDD